MQHVRRDSVSRGAEAHTGRSERPTNAIAGGGRLERARRTDRRGLNVFSLPSIAPFFLVRLLRQILCTVFLKTTYGYLV